MSASTTSPGSLDAPDEDLARWTEVAGIASAAATILLGLALWSYDLRGGENWIGPVGGAFAGFLINAFGVAACWLPVEFALGTLYAFRFRGEAPAVARLAFAFVILLVSCALLHLSMAELTVFGGHMPGGLLGEVLGEVMRSLIGLVGAYVLCVSLLLITLVLRTSLSVSGLSRRMAESVGESTLKGATSMRDGAGALLEAWREAKAIEREERERRRQEQAQQEADNAPRIVGSPASTAQDAEEEADEGTLDEIDDETDGSPAEISGRPAGPDLLDDDGDLDEGESVESVPPARNVRTTPSVGPTIVAPKTDARRVKSGRRDVGTQAYIAAGGQPFVRPSAALLDEADCAAIHVDEETLKDNAARLVETLEAYGVRGRVDEIHPGPVVTMYEFEPASGTKISKIANLADDLAMALAAKKVRIVAPIPGKARVGFELPNEHRQTVFLRELVEDERWANFNGSLPMALGKDIAGQPVYQDLAKMPHLLVAGATGAGKSVGLNVMLASLLMKKTPDEVRLLMIDPKVVELAVFDSIPHMLLPVVTDMKKASLALRWAVDEMERRYQLFADASSRNITSYNAKVDKVLSGEMSVTSFAPKRAGKVRAKGANGEEVLLQPLDGEAADAEEFTPEKLPSVVLVVDEYADLMMVAAKDVESAIARLAQKARAAGIHVILATQRPSVDVITGMIKANFVSRIAYKVTAGQDSKTILNRQGAEHLLGAGDMLALLPGSNDLKRVHSAFISEDEVQRVCDFLRAQGLPVYDDDILKPRDEDEGDFGVATSDDPLYDRAVGVVAQAGYCSISHIQRHLSVGYNKAAKLVDRMESEGVVGPASSKAGGRREVLIEAR